MMQKMPLTVGSLFSGIGGLELGLERAGMKIVWQVECDPYATKILKKNWPNTPRFGDIRHVHGSPENPTYPGCSECLPKVDIICGGFPCQDISVAGKGKGLSGERSGLWGEFRRVIKEVAPEWVVIENSPMLARRGLNTILGDLANLGFDAEWQVLPAAAFGAGHLRKRIFVIAYTNRHGRKTVFPTKRSLPDTHHQNRESQKTSAGWPDIEFITGKPSRWRDQPDVGRVANGVPNRVDRLRCLGNAVVPQVSEFVGRLIINSMAHNTDQET